jgi:hypothetical protein
MEDNYASPLEQAVASLIDAIIVVGILNIFILRPNTFPGLINTRQLMILGAALFTRGF